MKAQKDPLITLDAQDFEHTMTVVIDTIYRYQSQTNQANWKYGFRNKQESMVVYVRWLYEMARKNIKYKLDAPLKEEIRTPARTWVDRKKGVDCEDYCIFLSTILLNSNIKHSLRVADYGSGWAHIYIVVHYANTNIILDAVNPVFDVEKAFVAKKDYPIKPKKGLSGLKSNESGILKRIKQIKDNYPQSLVAFSVGDFYEFFNDDAIKISEISGKKAIVSENWTLLGIPKKDLVKYIDKVGEAGFSVAIVDQVEVSIPVNEKENMVKYKIKIRQRQAKSKLNLLKL